METSSQICVVGTYVPKPEESVDELMKFLCHDEKPEIPQFQFREAKRVIKHYRSTFSKIARNRKIKVVRLRPLQSTAQIMHELQNVLFVGDLDNNREIQTALWANLQRSRRLSAILFQSHKPDEELRFVMDSINVDTRRMIHQNIQAEFLMPSEIHSQCEQALKGAGY